MSMPLWLIFANALLALLAYMTVWFFVARYAKRIDMVDAAWSLGFVYLAVISTLLVGSRTWVQWLALVLVTTWGARLFSHIARRLAKHSEDARYATYRQQWGKHFWSKAYTNVFLLQGSLVLLVGVPLVAIMSAQVVMNLPLTIVGFVLWAFGIMFEATADRQLRKFVADQKDKKPDAVMEKGLWRYSRHPNYFGEITTWVGAAVVAWSLGQWWGIVGAIAIAVLIIKVSGIPPLEKHYVNNLAYQKYAKHTSVLIPRFPKK